MGFRLDLITGHKLLSFYFHDGLVFARPWSGFQDYIYDNLCPEKRTKHFQLLSNQE